MIDLFRQSEDGGNEEEPDVDADHGKDGSYKSVLGYLRRNAWTDW